MRNGYGQLGSRLLGDKDHIGIERGLAEFRAGRPVIVQADREATVALPVDGVDDERFAAFRALCRERPWAYRPISVAVGDHCRWACDDTIRGASRPDPPPFGRHSISELHPMHPGRFRVAGRDGFASNDLIERGVSLEPVSQPRNGGD